MRNLLAIRSYSTKATRHAHHYHQLVLPLRGVINIEVASFKGKVAPGECVVIKTNEQHLFTADTKARFIVADMDSLPDNICAEQHIVFAINKSLLTYLTFLENQLEQQVNIPLEDAMYQTFYLLLAEQTLLPKLDKRISTVLAFIDENLAEPLQIAHLAKVAFLSPTQFKKLFKQYTGSTVMNYITRLRMEKAQALLAHTDYPLQMIGEQIGYQELSAFSRRFSQYFGFPPTKFKR